MRVTESGIASNFLSSINRTRERINQEQSQLASGKRVLKVSDDPQAADAILRLKSIVDANEQYQKNTTEAQSQVETTEAALSSFSDIMVNVKEVMARASNGSQTENLNTYAVQIDQLLAGAVDIANTKLNGRYIFGGTNTLDPPFTLSGNHSSVTVNPNGITGTIQYPVSEGVNQVVNIDGQEAFQGSTIFDLMIQVRDNLQAGLNPTVAESLSADSHLDLVLTKTSKAGSILQNLVNNESMLADQRNQLLQLLSVQQDTDVAEVVTKLKLDELMLDAALNTGARIIPKSLLDFLR
jgi:flagellar hook-associated protein 3 FlgL